MKQISNPPNPFESAHRELSSPKARLEVYKVMILSLGRHRRLSDGTAFPTCPSHHPFAGRTSNSSSAYKL